MSDLHKCDGCGTPMAFPEWVGSISMAWTGEGMLDVLGLKAHAPLFNVKLKMCSACAIQVCHGHHGIITEGVKNDR